MQGNDIENNDNLESIGESLMDSSQIEINQMETNEPDQQQITTYKLLSKVEHLTKLYQEANNKNAELIQQNNTIQQTLRTLVQEKLDEKVTLIDLDGNEIILPYSVPSARVRTEFLKIQNDFQVEYQKIDNATDWSSIKLKTIDQLTTDELLIKSQHDIDFDLLLSKSRILYAKSILNPKQLITEQKALFESHWNSEFWQEQSQKLLEQALLSFRIYNTI